MRFVSTLFAATLLSLSSAAQSALVFTEYKFNDPKLSIVNLDGSGFQNLFSPANPFPTADWLPLGLALDAGAGHVYWSHGSFNDGRIRRANQDGSGQQVLVTNLKLVRGLALDLDGGKMYWANSPAAGNAGGLIERANLDGSARETVYAITPYNPSSSKIGRPTVDSTNGWVWFGADNAILRVNLDGPPFVARTVVTGLSTPTRVHVDVANGWVYGIDSDTISDCAWRARADDTDFAVVIDSTPGSVESSGLIDLELDRNAGHLYLADEIGNSTIERANVDGSGLVTFHATPNGWAPAALAFDVDLAQALEDCNNNGVRDLDDIASGASLDCNVDGVPDECQGADPCASTLRLLEQSVLLSAQPRALGGTTTGTGWLVFQPFDVPASGWHVGAVALDGFTTNYAPAGFSATLFPDNGANHPDETQPLGSGTGVFRFSHKSIEVELSASLPTGRHWIRLAANGAYTAAVHVASSGLPSFSRSNLGGEFAGAPIALSVREDLRFETFCAGDTSATACPCANFGARGRGCANSFPTFGARFEADGLASVASDSVVLSATGLPQTTTVLFVQSTGQQNGGFGTVLGDGLRCFSGSLLRLGAKTTTNGSAQYPGPGDASVSVRGLLPAAGGLRHYQAWYRDNAPFCSADNFNFTNALTADWLP